MILPSPLMNFPSGGSFEEMKWKSGKHNRPTPDRSWRATGYTLKLELDWFLKGAPDDQGVKQRRAKLSDSSAKMVVERFLGFVQFVDDMEGHDPLDTKTAYRMPTEMLRAV